MARESSEDGGHAGQLRALVLAKAGRVLKKMLRTTKFQNQDGNGQIGTKASRSSGIRGKILPLLCSMETPFFVFLFS